MPRGSAGQPKSAGQFNVYWRRRFIALAVGLGVLALVTWAVNGALGDGATRQATNLSQTTSQHPAEHSTRPAASSARPASTGATPSPTAEPTASPASSAKHGGSAKHGTSVKHGGSPQRHRAGRRRTAAAAGPFRACPRADLVLSLFSARSSYPAHARPQFSVNVVSTAAVGCTVNLGAPHLHIVITAGGKNQVWDSAACARPAPRAVTLARGVPAVVRVAWNRKTSAPRCRPPHRAARPGTYTAIAYSGKLSSRAVIFVLKGRGIPVP
jgi:hypothetical protein